MAVPVHGADVEGAVDAEAGHQARVGGGVEIVAPEQRGVFGGEHRMLVAVKDAVAACLGAVGPPDQLVMLPLEPREFGLEGDFAHGVWGREMGALSKNSLPCKSALFGLFGFAFRFF